MMNFELFNFIADSVATTEAGHLAEYATTNSTRMLGDRFAELGIATIIVIMILKVIMPHLTGKGGNGDAVMKANMKDLCRQVDNLEHIWTQERATRIDEIHKDGKENLTMHKVFGKDNVPVWHNREAWHETQRELVKEVKANTLETRQLKELLKEIVVIGKATQGNPWSSGNT